MGGGRREGVEGARGGGGGGGVGLTEHRLQSLIESGSGNKPNQVLFGGGGGEWMRVLVWQTRPLIPPLPRLTRAAPMTGFCFETKDNVVGDTVLHTKLLTYFVS